MRAAARQPFVVFSATHREISAQPPIPLPASYRSRAWRPSPLCPTPPGPFAPRLVFWYAMHALHGFHNRDYGALLIEQNGHAVHRSLVFPPYFAFPFMDQVDLQIGLTFTEPTHRGQHLAAIAIRAAVTAFDAAGRTFWYVAEAENEPSIRAAKRAGLSPFGLLEKRPRFGLGTLGSYHLAHPRS
jgi:RimJ/RimL family protein N-acetyltransferase